MIYALVEYVNKNGRISLKGFLTKQETEIFVKKLELKNAQYLVTIL